MFKARILVFSSLFPSATQPLAGIFIKERMFRIGKRMPIIVVSPVPWFPLQGIIRLFKPHYRPVPPGFEVQENIEVYRPRFFSIPGFFRSLDGLSMAVCSIWLVCKLKRNKKFNIIDAHFAYPDGYAATLLGQWLKVPTTITIRGTEVPLSKTNRKEKILKALNRATRVFSVADFLKKHVGSIGADLSKIQVIGNGVDVEKFTPIVKKEARNKLGIDQEAYVLVSVGGLVERKGFHRVIECLPDLCGKYPNLKYLIIGGGGGEGDISEHLKKQVEKLRLSGVVEFLGTFSPSELKVPLSASDLFILATRNEGWANVFLEAMACGLPVVTTDVGGNSEVVASTDVGTLVPFGDKQVLLSAIDQAIQRTWEKKLIISYARENSWESRVDLLEKEFTEIIKDNLQ